MEALVAFIPHLGAPAVTLLLAIFLYFKMNNERKATKVERDKDSEEIHDKLLKHDFEIQHLKDDYVLQRTINEDVSKQITELSKAVATLSFSVQEFAQSVKELRADIKELNKEYNSK